MTNELKLWIRRVISAAFMLGIAGGASAVEAQPANRAPVGGGSTRAGWEGEYFANPDFAGQPAFTRRDVRIHFDWKESPGFAGLPVGGATTPGMADFPRDDFSIRWTGALVARFSETYTLHVTGFDGVRLTLGGRVLVDSLARGGAHEVDVAFAAGETLDLVFEYVDRANTGASVARLEWSGPSTPREVIEPLSFAQTDLHLASPTTWNALEMADIVRMANRRGWQGADGQGLTIEQVDADGWPMVASSTLSLSVYGSQTYEGTYQIVFTGQAAVTVEGGMAGTWSTGPGGTGETFGRTLPRGKGHDPETNTTTAWFHARTPNHLGLRFDEAERAPGEPGVRDVRFYYPVARGSAEPHLPGEIYTREARAFFRDFVALRQHIGTSLNPGETWEERTLPSYFHRGHIHHNWGYNLEELIMAANDVGKDLHLCFGADWNEDFMRNFARMVRYGSDGVNPYDRHVENPKYPPLNPNLRIYLEHSNELPWAVYPTWVWQRLAAKVEANHPDWAIVNYDGQCKGADGRAMFRYHALRMKQMSDAFRAVHADVPEAANDRFRVLCFGQYAFTHMNVMLQFLDSYFNKADPASTYEGEPRPPSHHIWGGGGAIYYGTSNRFGLMEDDPIGDNGFEQFEVPAGTAVLRPENAGWTFTGNAGILDVRLSRQPALTGQTLAAEPAAPLPEDRWVGFKFTVGERDLHVYQLGRMVHPGNRLAHNVAIFSEDGQPLVSVGVNVHGTAPGSYAYEWCGTSAWGERKVVPLLLRAGTTYYLVSQEQRGRAADRFFGSDTEVTPAPGLTVLAAVSAPHNARSVKNWREVPGSRSYGPVNMIFTEAALSTAEGTVGVPPDNSGGGHRGRRGEAFTFGNQSAFLQGESSVSREFTVEKAGTYWITFNCALDMVSNGFTKLGWGGWDVTRGAGTIRVRVNGEDRTPVLLPRGGHMAALHVWHYMATRTFRLEPGTHTVTIERVSPGAGTAFIDEVYLSSEEAFYGGPDAPNFPSGGRAIGSTGSEFGAYHRTARAECDMARNWGLVPVTYEGGWAVQADFDHYSYLAWNDLRYGSETTNPELTRQALRNAFEIWCEQGGYLYAYFYAVTPAVANTDAPLLQAVREFNDELPREATGGLPIPGTLTTRDEHYQNNPNNDYYGFNASRIKAGPLLPPHAWKSWIVIAPETADYQVLLDASSGGRYQLDVNGFAVASGSTGDADTAPAVLRLTKGQHSIKVRNTEGLFLVGGVMVGAVGETLVRTGEGGLRFPEKPAGEPIDIRAACNRDIVDNVPPGHEGGGFAGFGIDTCVRGLVPGLTDFGYRLVHFDIVDAAQNGGNACIVLSGPQRVDTFPKASAPIAVGRKAAALYFLHTALYVQAQPGAAIVRYRIRYEDGDEAVFDCVNRVDLGDWWGLPNLPNGLAVYNQGNRTVMLTPWKNPNPEKRIESITMESTGRAISALFGITAADTLAEWDVIRAILEPEAAP